MWRHTVPNPTTAAEWAKNCQTFGHLRKIQEHLLKFPDLLLRALCETCADAYARQQVEAALQDARTIAHCHEACEGTGCATDIREGIDRLIQAAAIRALP